MMHDEAEVWGKPIAQMKYLCFLACCVHTTTAFCQYFKRICRIKNKSINIYSPVFTLDQLYDLCHNKLEQQRRHYSSFPYALTNAETLIETNDSSMANNFVYIL